MDLDIALGKHLDSAAFQNKTVTWDWFVNKCKNTHRTPETYKEFSAMSKKAQGKPKSAAGSFVGAYLANGNRSKKSVTFRSMLTLDADYASPGFWGIYQLNFECAGLIYSTHKHHPEAPRFRLIVPFSREVTPEEYEPISRKVAEIMGIDYFDHTTHDINRYMFWPTTAKDGEYVFKNQKGVALDPDEILGMYRDWRDISSWPMSSRENKVIKALAKKQGDPLEKEGQIGAFCRAFTISEAITEFLPEVYEESDVENRWTYAEGSTAGGLVIYEDKFAYSHHESDPASGHLCNAFDLVRIHRFGDLDEGKEGVPTNKLPSFVEMCDLAGEIPEVTRDIVGRRLERAQAEFDDDFDEFESDEVSGDDSDDKGRPKWWGELETDKRGNLETSYKNIRLILENDKKLKGRFGQNTFSDRVEVLKRLPWDAEFEDVRPWSDDDWASLREYLGKMPYKMKRTPMLEDVMSGVKLRNSFNPVKDYVESCRWDGESRIDTLLIDFLGAEDSEYTRAVTRATVIAMIARVYEPGCKFDNVLTLVGPERRGKSTFIRKLAVRRKWFSDTFNFGMLNGGNGIRAIEQIQGILITEIAEVSGLKKAEAEAVKSFISSDTDEYRPSHGRERVFRPRKGIFIASSNDRNFLTASNGNGRWWPVDTHVTEPELSVWDDFDEDYLAQIWAEAYQIYKKGEAWHLSKSMEAEARKHQMAHEQHDDWSEIIKEYLDNPDPDFEDDGMGTSEPLEKVCVAQIWEKALGGDKRNLNPAISRRIMNILRSFPDWGEYKSKTVFLGYGNLQGFYRIETKKKKKSKTIKLRKHG